MTLSARQIHSRKSNRRWPLWPLHVVLAVLFLGPVISPLFRATGLPLLDDAGLLARDLLATYVCPTPAASYLLGGLPMAVCARCWGATIGLIVARLAFTNHMNNRTGSAALSMIAAMARLPWAVRLVMCALPFLLWPLEIIGEAQGWWVAPLWVLLLNGTQAGCAAGFFFYSLWPGLQVRGLTVNDQ